MARHPSLWSGPSGDWKDFSDPLSFRTEVPAVAGSATGGISGLKFTLADELNISNHLQEHCGVRGSRLSGPC